MARIGAGLNRLGAIIGRGLNAIGVPVSVTRSRARPTTVPCESRRAPPARAPRLYTVPCSVRVFHVKHAPILPDPVEGDRAVVRAETRLCVTPGESRTSEPGRDNRGAVVYDTGRQSAVTADARRSAVPAEDRTCSIRL